MKFTLSWLKRHLETDATLEEISEKLTDIGLEVEEIEDRASTFAPFTVALVTDAQPHPDADKLQILKVKTATGEDLQVVCGAPNARKGLKGIFAPEGSYIPGLDVTLKKTKIRGVESNGMMVSEKEMCLSDEHKGIIELDESHEIGTPMAQIFGLDDPIIDIALTPNRGDCAGVRGIARDLAASGLGTLKTLDETPATGKGNSAVQVKIEDNEGCALFLGRTIRGVKNGPSPEWLQNLLTAVGLRPISALVDITNFLSLDLCRPLHVYDIAKLQGNIAVRATKQGEKLEALNDKSYELIDGTIGIYDESGLIGLGGIVGGTSTGCTEETTDVFLEAAWFDPMRIARAGRDLQIDSDARYRFERAVDPVFTATGMEIATRLILEICGGEASNVVTAGAVPDWQRTITHDPKAVEKLAGFDVPADRQNEILAALGFEIQGTEINPPPWRPDVHGQPDLVEEIIRIVGFDHLPAVSVRADHTTGQVAETLLTARARKSRSALAARGFEECVTWSFMNEERANAFGANDNAALKITNPINAEMDQMRPSILPNLIEAAARNHARGTADVALCEIGPVFPTHKGEDQKLVAAAIRAGSYGPRHWDAAETNRDVDLYDAKADALAVLEACGLPTGNVPISRDAPEYYHPGRSGSLRLGPNIIAYFGAIHPAILEEMDIKTPLVGFEVILNNIPAPRDKGAAKQLLKLASLQPVNRDFAFLLDSGVESHTLIRAVKSADKKLITAVDIFDIYTGKGVEEGKKSVAIAVTLQPQNDTLTEAELETLSQKIVANVSQKTGGELRG